jgi:Protein of unknown function (DUF1549)
MGTTIPPTAMGAPRTKPWAGVALCAAALVAASGCAKDDPNKLVGGPAAPCPPVNGPGGPGASGSGTGGGSGGGGGEGPVGVLEQRQINYPEALRTASFKLVGNAPTLKQIEDLRVAADPQTQYEAMIDELFADPRFARRMVEFWKNTMRMGDTGDGTLPSRDTAPVFAARVTVEGRPYNDLFTAIDNTCPTFDPATATFTDGSCPNGPAGFETAGVLTDPGIHAHYFGNFAFRRNRFFQETFACRKQPAELSATPIPMGNGSYTAPWDFESIAGLQNGGRVDFLDVSSAICANCHATANHRSPLFATFNELGAYVEPTGTGPDAEYAVRVPITGEPFAKFSDFLPAGEVTAWKHMQPAANLVELGGRMAADEEVHACAVARMWNFGMSKGDIVNDAASVPTEVIADLLAEFKNDYNLRTTLRAVFLHDDFVRF